MGGADRIAGKELGRVGTDCLRCLNCGGSVSLRVSRWGWGWVWTLVEERSFVVDSRPRTESKDGEHLHIAGEGAGQAQMVTDEGTSWSSKMSVRGELVTVWESRDAIGSLLSTGSAAERSD